MSSNGSAEVLAFSGLLGLPTQEISHDGDFSLDYSWEGRAVECALAFISADPPLEPPEALEGEHVAAPEELQHPVAQLHYEHLPAPHKTHRVHLRNKGDQHVLLLVTA